MQYRDEMSPDEELHIKRLDLDECKSSRLGLWMLQVDVTLTRPEGSTCVAGLCDVW